MIVVGIEVSPIVKLLADSSIVACVDTVGIDCIPAIAEAMIESGVLAGVPIVEIAKV